MNNKAQFELSPIAILFAVIAAIFGWWMAGRMDAPFIWKLITTIATAAAAYFIVWKVGESG